MNIDVNIERKDLVALSLHLLPRARANWITLLVVAFAIFIFLLIAKKPTTTYGVGIAVFSSIVGGVIGLLAGFSINLLTMLLTVGKKSGVLGKHHYALTEVGLHEVTEANESLHKWNGIQKIIKLPNCILFQVNNYLFHIIPRRAFNNEQHFMGFYENAKALRSAA